MVNHTDLGFKDTEVGPIPTEWNVTPLADVVLKTRNYDPTRAPDEEFRYIDVSSVSNELNRVVGFQVLLGQDAPSRARKHVRGGDVLFATVRPYLRNIAQVPEELDNSVCSTGYCVLRAAPQLLNADFLFFAVLSDSFVDRVAQYQSGSSYPAVSDKIVKGECIPLPPLPEQRRIAAVLNAIQEAIAAQEDVIAEARAFKRSLMQRLFTYGPGPVPAETKETEIGEIPSHWEVVLLDDVIASTQYGLSERADRKGQYPMLRMNNLGDGYVSTADLKYIDLDDETFWKFKLTPGDVLFNRTNSLELVGKTSLFDVEGDFVFASYLIRVVADPDRLLPGYLNFYLNLDDTQIRLKTLATRGVSQSNISATKLKAFEIPLAPLAEQCEIAVLLAEVDAKIAAEEDRKAALQDLFKATLHQLMTGQVRLLSDEEVLNLVRERRE